MRPLSPTERAMWLMDQSASMNGVLLLHVEGPLSAALLAEALRRMQLRHPLLRARIEAGPGQPVRFSDRDPQPIPVRVVPREGAEGWLAIAEEELNRTFSAGASPLVRATLIEGPQHHEVVLAYHHVIADAMSAIYQGQELLTLAAALAGGQPLPEPASLPLRPPMKDLVPAEARGWRRLAAMNSYLWHEGYARTVLRPKKLRPSAWAGPGARQTRILHHLLPAAETTALVARCRAERTTVQGLLCAALLLAVAEDLGLTRPAWVGCFSGVNLRERLRPSVGEESGLYVSQASTYHRLSTARDLWELSREAKERLQRTMARGEPYITFPLLGLFIPRGRDPGPRLVRRVDNAPAAATGITNVGRLAVPARYGPLTLTRLHFAIGAALIAPLVLAVDTFHGSLVWNVLHVEPLLPRERAQKIAQRIEGLVTEAVGARPAAGARRDSTARPSAGCGSDPPL